MTFSARSSVKRSPVGSHALQYFELLPFRVDRNGSVAKLDPGAGVSDRMIGSASNPTGCEWPVDKAKFGHTSLPG
jgi:hypothetical protein